MIGFVCGDDVLESRDFHMDSTFVVYPSCNKITCIGLLLSERKKHLYTKKKKKGGKSTYHYRQNT